MILVRGYLKSVTITFRVDGFGTRESVLEQGFRMELDTHGIRFNSTLPG